MLTPQSRWSGCMHCRHSVLGPCNHVWNFFRSIWGLLFVGLEKNNLSFWHLMTRLKLPHELLLVCIMLLSWWWTSTALLDADGAQIFTCFSFLMMFLFIVKFYFQASHLLNGPSRFGCEKREKNGFFTFVLCFVLFFQRRLYMWYCVSWICKIYI